MPNLMPSFDVPQNISIQNGQQPAYLYNASAMFDFEAGDFVRDGSHKIQTANGYDAWIQWCLKTVYTQRFACLAYSSEIGTESDVAEASPDRKSAESALERTITEAIMADPMRRTQYVRDFSFDWDGDSVRVSFSIYGANGAVAALNAQL